ncbi:unnamed protein product (macronuclear) [Paramecium tetraurelia]|uniref:Uncharacterized protein n=1 Tax=Paramecium tetraurelia TaxID=5888 RepID=A0DX58_PARTE|nr:uncharacterized protein GSPATT00021257001 [Paramecium tetraurelia]CAK87625.1 unnamed protein product [Paramecium tetraurelia]|eukprot:XP_001455022.1 hypothetical protein (macronuclear) [Paramecium tetraurelia strain d4-2]
MEKLKQYRESNLDQEFNGYNECERIVLNNMKGNFSDLCLSIQQSLDNDKQRYISQFSMVKLCFRLTLKKNEEFLFAHFQNIVLPSIRSYIFNNQNYSKELEPKAQQFILSSVILCKELLSFWAHAYPQTSDYSTSKFLSEYQIYKKQQKENAIVITKKNQYTYLKQNFYVDKNYKFIKDKWKRQNLVSDFVSDEEPETQSNSNDNKVNNTFQKEIHQDNKPQIINNDQAENKQEGKQILDNLNKQISERKKELEQLDTLVSKRKKELQQLDNSISSQPKTADSDQSHTSRMLGSSQNNKDIFDSMFNFDGEKFPIKKQYEDIPLVSIDTSYPQKKRRLLDGQGVFHVQENFLLARQQKIYDNTIDVAIYLKCIEKPMKDLQVQIKCEDRCNNINILECIYPNLKENNNLEPEQQIRLELRNIDKSLLTQNDIEVEINIDWQQGFPEIITFYLKLTNIVTYNYAIEQELVKEYQNIPKVLISKQFSFDSEVFPNGLEDVQKCIQYSINYKVKNQLLLSGSLNKNAFICRITLDEEGKASVIIKKLQNEELAKRLTLAYIEALQRID